MRFLLFIIVIILIIGFIATICDAIMDFVKWFKKLIKRDKSMSQSTRTNYNIASELANKFILIRNELYSGNKSCYSLEFEQEKKELNILASDIVNHYCKCLNDGDYDSANKLMIVVESTSHIYEGDKYSKKLLEDIMREEAKR